MDEKPPWLSSYSLHNRYGYIDGLSGDKLAYAAQASRQVFLQNDSPNFLLCADILPMNRYSLKNWLYIGFTHEQCKKMASYHGEFDGVLVTFELNHGYFKRLCDAVNFLDDRTVQRIVPEEGDFGTRMDSTLKASPLDRSLGDDSQKEAFKTAITVTENTPPVVVSGPFGCGKTYILALSCKHFLEDSTDLGAVRILVCTQQHVSADAFFHCFNHFWENNYSGLYSVVRLIHKAHMQRDRAINCYKLINEIPLAKERMLIITTCSTAFTLFNSKHVPKGFFTHILLDECAQMREPEAVAPLCFAVPETKIIIAGDHFQVILLLNIR